MIRALIVALAALAVGPAAAQQTAPVGKWLAEQIGGEDVAAQTQTTLELTENGEVTGSGGCNQYRGNAEFSITAVNFGLLASTEKACAPEAMAQETKFHKALEEVRAWHIDDASRKLSLLDANGAELVRLAPLP